jgi:hypothetical protein
MRFAAGVVPACLAACLALAGCGTQAPSKADFRTQYAPLSAAIRGLGDDVAAAVAGARGKPAATIEHEFSGLATRAGAAATALEDVRPPDDASIRGAQAALVAGVRRAATDLKAVAGAAAARDSAAASAATAKLIRDAGGVREPRQRLDQLALSSG